MTSRRREDELRAIIDDALSRDDVTGWFEPLYERARGDATAVPWARQRPHGYLVTWLDQHVGRAGSGRAVVVGCGLGDDAEELARRGFDVTAFDVSETAIRWAQRRFPTSKVDYRVADLLALPEEWRGGFDLVVETRTVQSLPEPARDAAMRAIASLVAPGGQLLAVALVATSSEVAAGWQGPPWALAPSELASYRAAGLAQGSLEHPPRPDADGSMEVRMTWTRPA